MIKAFMKNIKMMKYVFKACPKYFITSIFYIIFKIIVPVSSVYLIQYLVDEVINILNNASNAKFINVIIIIAIYLIINLIANIIISIYESFLMGKYRMKYMQHLQELIYKKARNIDMKDFDNPEFYDLYSRALREGMRRGIVAYEQFVKFIASLLTTIVIGSIIVLSDYLLVILLLASCIITVLIKLIIQKINYNCYKETEKNRRVYYYVNRTFYQQRFAAEIKTTNISNLLIDKYEDHAQIINKKFIKMQTKTGILELINQIFRIGLEYASKYIYLGKKLFDGMSVSVFTSTINAAGKFTSNFTSTISFLSNMKDNSYYIDDFIKYISYQPTLETVGKENINNKLEELKINNITFKYSNEQPNIIDNLTLNITKGEKLAIVGLNGAGKTTLIKLLLKFYEINSGDIYYNNQSYKDLKENSIRDEYSIIFQDYKIYATTIAQNVMMRKTTQEDEKIVLEALDKVGLKEKVLKLPKGIYTEVTREFDDNGASFSGGENQRLVIARVFASKASISILDEPTSALDPIAEKEINNLLIDNVNDKTIILIAHRLSTVVGADRIILLEKGRIVEDGTHQELMDKRGIYYKMFTTQASLYKKS